MDKEISKARLLKAHKENRLIKIPKPKNFLDRFIIKLVFGLLKVIHSEKT